MPAADLDLVRTSLHVLAAAVWVGGLVARATGAQPAGDGPVARRGPALAAILWGAYVVVLATGIWHLTDVRLADRDPGYHSVLLVKLLAVGLSGVGAAIGAFGRGRTALAAGDGVAVLGAAGALSCGVWLTA